MRNSINLIIFISFFSLAKGESDLKVEVVPKKTIVGISVRTSNAEEMKPGGGQISKLWEQFYGEVLNNKVDGSPIYGLYTNYESDFTGEYTVLAGVEVESEMQASKELEIHNLVGGKYLVFKAQGEMPQIVVETWGKVWEYFSSSEARYVKSYTSDFELYENQSEISIYIAVK